MAAAAAAASWRRRNLARKMYTKSEFASFASFSDSGGKKFPSASFHPSSASFFSPS